MNKYRNDYLNFDITLEHIKLYMLNQDFMIDVSEVSYTFDSHEIKQVFNTKEDALDYVIDLLNYVTKEDINLYINQYCKK